MTSSLRTQTIELLTEAAQNGLVSVHLDAAANAPTTEVVRVAVMTALEGGGNPSSAHGAGDQARAILTEARDAVADLCDGLFPEGVIFTSGCTEANNLVIASAQALGATLVTSAVEHASILRPAEALAARGGSVVFLPVNRCGLVDLDVLESVLANAVGPLFLSVQAANSETGVIQPIDRIAAIAARHNDILFHTDAAQAFGKSDLMVGMGSGPDVVSVSAHKLHGPMGVGALLLSEGEDRLQPLIRGGDQEGGLRAGTQALPLVAGFGAACVERKRNLGRHIGRMALLRDRLETGVQAALPQVVINGGDAPRLANISNTRFPGLDGMALVAQLDAEGVLASQGSACHSRRPEPSHVLMAMGLEEDEAFASVRFSVSPLNTEAEIDAAVSRIVTACRHLGLRA